MAVRGLGYVKSAERWQRYGETYHDEARTYYTEINKTCLTIATFLIGFIGIFLQIGSVNTSPLFNKILLTVAFVFPVISIAVGVYLFFQANKFLNHAGDYYEILSERLHLWIIKNKQEAGDEYPSEIYKGIALKEGMNATLSYIQLIFLAIGFVSIASYFILSIYQPLEQKYSNNNPDNCISKALKEESSFLISKGYRRMNDGSWRDLNGNFPNSEAEKYLNKVYENCVSLNN